MYTNILVYENRNFVDLPTVIMTEEMVLRLDMSKFEPRLPKTLYRVFTSFYEYTLLYLTLI